MFEHPRWSRITFGKTHFRTIFDPLLVPKWPIFREFWDFHVPKHVTTGSKWAKNTCLSIPSGPGSLLEKRVFDPFLTDFCSGPFSRHFGIFGAQKRATTGSKWAENTCLSIQSGLGPTLEKMIFFALGTLVDPPLAPAVRGPGCPPDPPSEHWYGALGVSFGDFAPPSPVHGAVPGLTMTSAFPRGAFRVPWVSGGGGGQGGKFGFWGGGGGEFAGNHKKWGVAGGLGALGIGS